jgi:hypothetical protein
MGANAQTTVPSFTVGQVLTADQQNQSARTGVPVFATTVERDAAFGGAGEKTLAEGQLAYLEDSDVVQYYDGAAWATVGPSADSGLTLISTTTIGSAVASVTVTGAFSATYDNYRIVVSGGVGSANGDLRLTYGATATGYYWAGYNSDYASASLTANQGANVAFHYGGRTSANQIDFVADVFSPFLAKNTVTHSRLASTQIDGFANVSDGYLADATSYTAFTLTRNTGTMTGGEVRVYGYKN